MKKKLRNRKPSYRNAIAVASAVILGSSVMLNENVWAHVQSIWYTIDEVFSLKKEEVKDYTYNIDKTVEDKNIKILFKKIKNQQMKIQTKYLKHFTHKNVSKSEVIKLNIDRKNRETNS